MANSLAHVYSSGRLRHGDVFTFHGGDGIDRTGTVIVEHIPQVNFYFFKIIFVFLKFSLTINKYFCRFGSGMIRVGIMTIRTILRLGALVQKGVLEVTTLKNLM